MYVPIEWNWLSCNSVTPGFPATPVRLKLTCKSPLWLATQHHIFFRSFSGIYCSSHWGYSAYYCRWFQSCINSSNECTSFDWPCVFPIRDNSILDGIINNHPNLLSVKLRTPISGSDHWVVLLRPKIYLRPAFHSFKQPNQTQIRLLNSFHTTTLLFFRNPFHTECFSFESRLSEHVKRFAKKTNAIYDIFCTLEILFAASGRISSQILKSPRRRNQTIYKSRSVRNISTQVKAEINRIHTTYASQLLSGDRNRFLWQSMRLLCGKKRRYLHCSSVNNSTTHVSIHIYTYTSVIFG